MLLYAANIRKSSIASKQLGNYFYHNTVLINFGQSLQLRINSKNKSFCLDVFK